MRDSMSQCAGLARACAGNHEERPAWRGTWIPCSVLYGPSLCRIQPFKMGKGHGSRSPQYDDPVNHDSCFVRNRLFKAVDRSAVERLEPIHVGPLTAFEGGRLCPLQP
jgi:hypothetical protein